MAIPRTSREYAINASNARHWPEGISAYIRDCVSGSDGPLGRNHNTRWIASMVAEAHRILIRGGVYLYPADRRDGYRQGRLRLLYEAAPIAFLCSEAGGAATDGMTPILERTPKALHERTPLVFGSADQVEQVRHYCTSDTLDRDRPPLFAERGLFRT
jgi:fructose-1,6-bisphosphatase I